MLGWPIKHKIYRQKGRGYIINILLNNIPDDDNELTANFKTIYCCAKCNAELPQDKKFITRRIPNPYMTEDMIEHNKQSNPEKAHLINEVNEKEIIICPNCNTRNKIHDYRWC